MSQPAAMTPEMARSFERYSPANATTVTNSLPCGCKPYVDVFTYRRWKAQGFQVKKGEKAVHIPVIRTVYKENGQGETETRKIRRKSYVFCRCQVKPCPPDKNK